ncbi:MAG: DUF5009 domain-containing protein [Flavobacteriaceae bacterium]|nr:MAG: DUF5009 domain-containing protein [Flavobacteriaceae bacterium]
MTKILPNRIKSIDVFRGFTMLLLIGEFTQFFELIPHDPTTDEGFISIVGRQLHHHPWNGLRFWDLIQPFFMFIVGLSLPFAINNRIKKGNTSKQIFKHVFKRSIILLVLGWALYCIANGSITTYFQNVLAQIGITYLIAYLIMKRTYTFQILFSIGLLIFADALYLYFPVDGFNHPYILGQNFGAWFDSLYGGADINGGWNSFNAIPTAAHTIWGVLVGKLLLEQKAASKKLKQLLLVGLILVVVGYAMDPLVPIIKRIATSSFVLVSGGWAILIMALLYWLIDIRKLDGKWTLFFSVVSMNSLFIYLFAHLNGGSLIEQIVHPFTNALFAWSGVLSVEIITSLFVWSSFWGLCYWMYKKQLFIKI